MYALLVLLASLFSPAVIAAEAIYTKSSPVLQVNAKDYQRLIAKSNYTSILEFYAPWCGHCQNLKPAYEKAATSLNGLAKVAAINCDEESNKAFCGQMGVQGFPTLKIVKPAKKIGGQAIVEDYQGARTAKAIREAVLDKIPNHVARLKDGELDAWLNKETSRPKALFFSEKGVVSPIVKAVAIDFLGSINVAQIRSTEKKAAEKFDVKTFPSILLLTSSDAKPMLYEGESTKDGLIKFFSQAASPNPENSPLSAKGKKPGDKQKKDKTEKKSNKAAEASCPMGGGSGPNPHDFAASETVQADTSPIQSPGPNVATDKPNPVKLPVEPAPPLQSLEDESALQKTCLHTRSTTCILVKLPTAFGDDTQAAFNVLGALSEIAHTHAQRGAKLFPFYSIPGSNEAGNKLVTELGATQPVEVLAINAKRGWWNRYDGGELGRDALESWVDQIRFGDGKKDKLPEGLVREIQKEVEEEAMKIPKVERIEIVEESEADAEHDEL